MYAPLLGRFISPDSMVTDPSVPAALNRYAYVGNNPLNYTDPDGHCWPVCTAIAGGVIGGIVGAVSAAAPHVIHNIRQGQPLFVNIDPGEVAKAAAVGAVAGAVGGVTFVGATAVLGTSVGAAVVAGAGSGVLAGQAGQVADNVLSGRAPGAGLGNAGDMALDAITGGALGGAGRAVQRTAAKSILQNIVDHVDESFHHNPGQIKLVGGERAQGITPMNYGKAIERAVTNEIEGSRLLKGLYEHVTPAPGRMSVDFKGRGVFGQLKFDITTPAQAATKAEKYGRDVIVVTHRGPR